MRLCRLPLFSIWLLVAVALPAHAQTVSDEAPEVMPVVEVSIEPSVVAVGEPTTLTVAVYVPTWFPKPPVFPSFEVPNAATRRPPDSSRPVTKRIGGQSWSGVTRRYEIYPLMGSEYRLASDAIEVTFAQPGSTPWQVQVETGDIRFRAEVPAGAEGLDPYVAGERLTLERRIDGDLENLAVGDALVVTYEARLSGLPAIFIPELVHAERIPGVSAYPGQPVVSEGSPALRTEPVTFVFNAGGTFVLPGATVDWWDRTAGVVERSSIEPLTVNVAGPTVASDDESAAHGVVLPRWLIALVVVGAVLLYWGPGWMHGVQRDRDERRARREASEAHAWHQLEHALHSGDAAAAQRALTRWCDRLVPGIGVHGFASEYGEDDLESLLEALGNHLYGAGDAMPDLRALKRSLAVARERCQDQQQNEVGAALPTLNP